MLGAGCWSLSLQCAVERHAIGHRCCCCMLSSSSSHRALSLLHHACRHRRTVPPRRAPCCRRMPSSSSPCIIIIVVTMHHRRCRHHASLSSLCHHLAVPRAVVHCRCTVVPLSCHWIRHCHLPPSSLLHRLCHHAVRCHCHGAIGHRRRTIFTSPGPLPSLLGIAVPCTCLTAPLCHPAVSICVIVPLCTVVGVGGCGTCGWALGDQHRTLVHSTRAFGPSGRWM